MVTGRAAVLAREVGMTAIKESRGQQAGRKGSKQNRDNDADYRSVAEGFLRCHARS
jgi:hypothetical protein